MTDTLTPEQLEAMKRDALPVADGNHIRGRLARNVIALIEALEAANAEIEALKNESHSHGIEAHVANAEIARLRAQIEGGSDETN
jgi:hypothetical protein